MRLEQINQNYLEDFGKFVRIHRVLQNLTLRDLAKNASLSHTLLNKVETGQQALSNATYTNILKALNVSFKNDYAMNEQFKEYKKVINDAILYADSKTMIDTFMKMDKNSDYFMQSIYVIDYLILVLGVYHAPTLKRVHKMQYIHALKQLEKLMTVDQQVSYYFHRGFFAYFDGKTKEAIEDFLMAMEVNDYREHHPLVMYYLAKAYSEDYQLSLAEKYFNEAIVNFEQNNNMLMAMYTKLYDAINTMKSHNLTDAESKLLAIQTYAENTAEEEIVDMTIMHRMALNLMRQNYEVALMLGQGVSIKNYQYYFYTAYAAFSSDESKELSWALEMTTTNFENLLPGDRFHYQGLQIIEMLSQDDTDADDLGDLFELFFDHAIQIKSYVEADLMYPFYRDFLVEHRQYKKAYELTETMRNVISEAMY